MEQPSNKEIATDYELWCEYVDPNNEMEEDEFNLLSIYEKLEIIEDCFGKDC